VTRLRRIASLIVGCAALAAVVLAVDLGRLAEATAGADALLVAIAVVLAAVNLLAQYLKWELVLRSADASVPPAAVLRSLLAGMAAGMATPGRVGEFAGRASGLGHLGAARIASLTAVDKLFSLASALCIGAAGALFVLVHLGTLAVAPAAVAAAVAVCLMLVLPLPAMPRLRVRRPALLARLLENAADPLHNLTRPHRYALLARTVCFHAVYVAQLVVLLHAFGYTGILPALTAGAALLLVKTALSSFVPAGLGIREASTVGVCLAMDIPAAAALNAALVILVVNVLVPAAAGGVLLMLPRRVLAHSAGSRGA
jgi:glycosyltransferase 2 family protein